MRRRFGQGYQNLDKIFVPREEIEIFKSINNPVNENVFLRRSEIS